jgi:peptidoglycan/xylan/chitin deacetylase (PgdA/CDA1 family)
MSNGHFVISLDFELYWGVRDKRALADYREHLAGVPRVIHELIRVYDKHNVRATFATVGFLFLENKEEWLQHFPDLLPDYADEGLSPYTNEVVESIKADTEKYHFAPALVRALMDAGHEVGCHTFSHYYCLEEGQTTESFRSDLRAAKRVAGEYGIALESIVFPRNQYAAAYLDICCEEGFTSFRGTEDLWMYRARAKNDESLIRRLIRLVDSYINISGRHCYSDEQMAAGSLCNIPSSRLLRAYNAKLRFLEWLRLRRIKRAMTYAAKRGLTYHIWWHPHNFGKDCEVNISFLEKILEHFSFLNEKYGFESVTMRDLAKKIKAPDKIFEKAPASGNKVNSAQQL